MVRAAMREQGATYLALLFAVAFVSSVLASSATIWSQAQQREREKQLLWAGEQFRQALLAYAKAGNGSYPRKLEDLLEDPRTPAKRRFLRQIYEDPMTRTRDWELMRNPFGGIVGVHSRSQGVPVKTGQFPEQYTRFERALTYAEWKFAAVQPKLEMPAPAEAKAERDPRAPQPLPDGPVRAGEPREQIGTAPGDAMPRAAEKAPPRSASKAGAGPIQGGTADTAPSEVAKLPPSDAAKLPPSDAGKLPRPEAAKAANAESAKSTSSATAPSTPGAAAQPSAAGAVGAGRPDVADAAQRTPGAFAPSPLTPLQTLQSPFSPGGFGMPSPTPAAPTKPPGADPQPATQSR